MAKRILVADDSLTIQKAFAMTFGAEDLALSAARSADEGLNLARQLRPDMVIADASMPGRSGYELCAAIKADAGLRATPVYILASSHHPYDEAKGQQVGADGHLMKPWDSAVLIDRVRDAIGKGPSATVSSWESPSPSRVGVPAVATTSPGLSGRPTVPAMQAPAAAEEYGDIAVDTAREMQRPQAPAPASHAPAPLRSTSHGLPGMSASSAPPGQSGAVMRPSLIPGVRPGAVPPARPGTSPVRPMGLGGAPPGGGGGGVGLPPRPATPNVGAGVGRTMIGLPAASLPMPGTTRPPGMGSSMPASMTSPLARPPTAPVAPLSARSAPAPAAHGPAMSAFVSSAVDHKVASIAARGPEYEALAKLSREVIEQIVWEIVPELAELIIREHMEKRGGGGGTGRS